MGNRGLLGTYLDGEWTRSIWFIAGILIVLAIIPTVVSLAGGVLRRGGAGVGPFFGHGILVFALIWGAVRVSSSFADYFYPGRPATSIIPITFAVPTGKATPDGQAMAGFAAGVLHRIEAKTAEIKKLKDNLDEPEFEPWVGTKPEGRYDIIKFASGQTPGFVALTTTAPKEQVKVQIEGTDISSLIAWAMTFLVPHNTVKTQITDLGGERWQIVYNVDAAGLDNATLTLDKVKNAEDATSAFAWDYARRTTRGYSELPALRRMTLEEYQLFLDVYEEFAQILNSDYEARIPGVSDKFKPDSERFCKLLVKALGTSVKGLSCHQEQPGPAADGSAADLTDGCKVPSSKPAATNRPAASDQPAPPDLLMTACKWSELSRFLGTIADLAKKDNVAKLFFETAAGLELQRADEIPPESKIPGSYLTKVKPGVKGTYGLVTTNPAPFPGEASTPDQRLFRYEAGAATLLVSKSAGDGFEPVAYALQDMLSQSETDTIVLDLPSSALAQPVIRYLLKAARDNSRKFILTTRIGGPLPPDLNKVSDFIARVKTVENEKVTSR